MGKVERHLQYQNVINKRGEQMNEKSERKVEKMQTTTNTSSTTGSTCTCILVFATQHMQNKMDF
jgi:hypothetical protein